MKLSAKDSAKSTPPQRHPTHLQLRRPTASTTPRLRSTRGRRRNRGRRSHQHLMRRPATTAGPAHQEPQPPKAEKHPQGQVPTCHRPGQGAPMIRDEEQRARELEQEIALIQSEGQHSLQQGPPLQQRVLVGDLFIPQRRPFISHVTAFQGINYLDE
jgi:hypothetical protein